MNTNTKSDLSKDLSFMKGVGIVLVVIGHVLGNHPKNGIRQLYETDLTFLKSLSEFIYSFHMPLFFIISGIAFGLFSKKEDLVTFLKSKFLRLLVPMLFWAPIFYAVQASIRYSEISYANIARVLIYPYSIFWFINTLFVVSLFAFLLVKIARSKTIYFLSSAVLYLFSHFGTISFLGVEFNSYIYWNLLFAIGLLFAPTLWEIRPACKRINPNILVATFLLLFIIMFSIYHFTPYEFYPYVKIINGILFSFALLLLSIFSAKALPQRLNQAILDLGIMSMVIYLLHIFFSSGLRILLSSYFGVSTPGLHLLAGSLAGIIGPLLVYQYLNTRSRLFMFSIGQSRPSASQPIRESRA